jgi:small subunit ribosomal protein S9
MATTTKKSTYIEAVGRRKTSVARVRLFPSTKDSITVNDKDVTEYFPVKAHQGAAEDAIKTSAIHQKFDVTAKIHGGGVTSQAEALRHGIARALIKYKPELRAEIKKAGFLKRDPRMKERKKFGLKKARRAPQWSKR